MNRGRPNYLENRYDIMANHFDPWQIIMIAMAEHFDA
jgi:hypothetical protein